MPPKRPAISSSASRAKRVKTSARPVRVVRSFRGVPIPNVRANAAKKIEGVKIVKILNPRGRGAFTITATSAGRVGDSGVIDGTRYMIRSERQLRSLVRQKKWRDVARTCTSLITDFSDLFRGVRDFNASISHWDTSSVTNMRGMFHSAAEFNQPIGAWDTSSVRNMESMFSGYFPACTFNQPIGGWDTSSVTNMSWMFSGTTAFNQPIGRWDTSSVRNMKGMFHLTRAFNQPIGGWDTSSVTRMDQMLSNAFAFNQPIGNWNTSSVTSMEEMFFAAAAFNQPIGAWDTSSVTDMRGMFLGLAKAFNQDISQWIVRNSKPRAFARMMIEGNVRRTVRRLRLKSIFTRKPRDLRIRSVQMLEIVRETYPWYRPSQLEYEKLHEFLRNGWDNLGKKRVIALIDFLNREEANLPPRMRRYNKTRSRSIISNINQETSSRRAAAIDSINQAAAKKELHLPRELVAKILTAASIKTLPYTHYIQR